MRTRICQFLLLLLDRYRFSPNGQISISNVRRFWAVGNEGMADQMRRAAIHSLQAFGDVDG
jgi:hypothetical protein